MGGWAHRSHGQTSCFRHAHNPLIATFRVGQSPHESAVIPINRHRTILTMAWKMNPLGYTRTFSWRIPSGGELEKGTASFLSANCPTHEISVPTAWQYKKNPALLTTNCHNTRHIMQTQWHHVRQHEGNREQDPTTISVRLICSPMNPRIPLTPTCHSGSLAKSSQNKLVCTKAIMTIVYSGPSFVDLF